MTKLFIKTLCAIFLIVMTSLAAIVFWAFLPKLASTTKSDFKSESALEYRIVLEALEGQPTSDWQNITRNYPSYFELDVSVVKAQQIPSDASIIDQPLLPLEFASTRYIFADDQSDEDHQAFYPSPDPQWYLKFVDGDSELPRNVHEAELFLLLFLSPPLFILIAMLLGIGYLLYAFSRPLLVLEQAVLKFADGDHNTRIDAKKNQTIARVCRAFNSMAEQINNTLKEQQLMIAVIPHELRTPINRIRFSLDLCRGQQLDQVVEQLERLDGYSYELEQAIEDILLLINLSNRQSPKQKLNCKTLIENSCDAYPNLLGLTQTTQNAFMLGNVSLMQRAFDNLLANAQRYTKTYVKISCKSDRNFIRIQLENDCENMTQEQVDHLFDPFYRTDVSRSRETGGIGIGLTLIKRIIENEGGSISVHIPAQGNICFSIKLPQAT